MFGWKRKSDGTRRYRTVYVEIPRKNGKSSLAAGIALYLTIADGEPGGEVYSAAGDRGQAAIVFNTARTMRDASNPIRKRTEGYKRSILHPRSGSVYKVLSADAFTKHGLNASGVLFDEVHVQPNRDLWDALDTSTGSRSQPIMFAITTAGYDRNSLCWELHDYAIKILRGQIVDDEFLAVVYPPPSDDPDDDMKEKDFMSRREWRKANPNLGVSVSIDYLEKAARRAHQIPAFENTFRRLHLNEWTQQAKRWMPMKMWDKSAGVVDLAELEGRKCYGGLDLASTTDIAALVLTFFIDGVYKWVPFFWIPEANMKERVRRDRVPYDVWVKQKLVKPTEGNVIDYDVILKDVETLLEVYDIKEIAYDRWGASKISTEIAALGITVVPFGQGYYSMSSPTKELLNLVLQEKLHHDANPVMRWMAGNVVTQEDSARNIKPNKTKSTSKIDGIVAGIMSLDRAVRCGGTTAGSVYDDRGAREL